MVRIFILLLLSLFTSTSCSAAYIALTGGAIFSNGSFAMRTESSYRNTIMDGISTMCLDDLGLDLSGAYGTNFYSSNSSFDLTPSSYSWSAEIEVGYRNYAIYGVPATKLAIKQGLIMLNGYFNYPIKDIFSIFIGAGIGATGFYGSGEYLLDIGQTNLVYGKYDGLWKCLFVGQIRVGASVMLSSVTSLFIDYQLLMSPTQGQLAATIKTCDSRYANILVWPTDMVISGIKIMNSAIELGARFYF